jgi:hypothetical protein
MAAIARVVPLPVSRLQTSRAHAFSLDLAERLLTQRGLMGCSFELFAGPRGTRDGTDWNADSVPIAQSHAET